MGTDETEQSGEGSPHDLMERYDELGRKERSIRSEKQSLLETVGDELTGVVESAIADVGANVGVESTSKDGTTITVAPRLDRTAVVAQTIDDLPNGFSVKRLTSDGQLIFEWDRKRSGSREHRAKILLRVIVSELLETDADELITTAPTREAVVERAEAFDVSQSLAEDRLDRLAELDVLTIDDGLVFPGSNFSNL